MRVTRSQIMRVVYPVILEVAEEGGYLVTVPDFRQNTEGDDLADALYMAQDMISIMCVVYQDKGKELPASTPLDKVKVAKGEIKTLVFADLKKYRKMLEKRSVKKTLTLPGWLNSAAEAAHINFSATLQEALKEKLDVA